MEMKIKQLLEQLNSFLNADAAAQKAEMKQIKSVLKELKEKERKLQDRLERTKDTEEREELKTKLAVIYAQRRKGVDRVKELKEQLKPASECPPDTECEAEPVTHTEQAQASTDGEAEAPKGSGSQPESAADQPSRSV
jgi:chromosome segregation ATPase